MRPRPPNWETITHPTVLTRRPATPTVAEQRLGHEARERQSQRELEAVLVARAVKDLDKIAARISEHLRLYDDNPRKFGFDDMHNQRLSSAMVTR